MNQLILVEETSGPGSPKNDEIRLTTFLSLVWRRRWIALAAFLAVIVLGLVYLTVAERTYIGEARIYVQQSGPRLIGDHREELALAQTDQFAAAQADIITSASVLSRTAAKVENLKSLIGVDNIFRHLREQVSAGVDRKTQLISVYYQGTDPNDAATVANSVVESYMSFERAERRAAAERTLDALKNDRKSRTEELAQRTRELVEMQNKYGAISLGDDYTTVVTDHLSKLSAALIEARLEVIETRAAYEEAVRSLKVDAEALQRFESTQDIETFAAIPSKEQSADQRQMISVLQVKLREAQRLSGPRHPQVIAYRTQLEQVVMSYVSSLKQAMLSAQTKLQDVEQRLKDQQELANQLTGTAFEYARLRNETKRLEKLIEAINDRINEVEVTVGAPIDMVRMVDPARPPEFAASPRPLRVLGMSSALGMMLAFGLSILAEWYNPRVRSIEQVKSVINAPILGVIPRMLMTDPVARYRAAMLEPSGIHAEAYRMVRTSFLGQHRGRCKTIVITSAVAEEGKSTVAQNLAIVLAQTGQRVLLIDADMRNSQQHMILDRTDASGLSDVLEHRVDVHSAIFPGTKLSPDLLPPGSRTENPAELLNSPAFGELLHNCADTYDFIVIDTPPVGCVADARIIAAQCDKTILVVRAEFSNPRSCATAYQSLQLVGADVAGLVINDVSAGEFGEYGINSIYPYRKPGSILVASNESEQPVTGGRIGHQPLAG